MKSTGLVVVAILGLLLSISIPSVAAGIHNVSLQEVQGCAAGVTGTATVIVGDICGSNPYHNVEINMRLCKAPAANMVYQGWLIDSKDNLKTSLGAFNGTRLSSRQKMVNFADNGPYDSIAVSLEPASNMNPNPSTLVAQGNLPGASVSASEFTAAAILPEEEAFQEESITQRSKMTRDQFVALRMQGFGYDDISMIGNAAAHCNKAPSDIASQIQQGQTWDQIASSCNMTVAQLMQPYPTVAVAGSVQQIGMPVIHPYMYYKKYANGSPVITYWMWRELYKHGVQWKDAAVAANISAMTGEGVPDLLRETRIQGQTWAQMSIVRGLDPMKMMDVSGWPFGNEPMQGNPPATMDVPTASCGAVY